MARHLDPFNQTIRAIRSNTTASESDRRAAIKLVLEIRNTATLTTAQAVIACRGVIAMLEALAAEVILRTVEQGSPRHKALVWIHSKHLEEMNKCFTLTGKHTTSKSNSGKRGTAERAAMWHPQVTARAPEAKDPESSGG